MVVDSQRRGGALNYNRSFYDEAQMADRVAAYLDVLRLMATDAGRPAGQAAG